MLTTATFDELSEALIEGKKIRMFHWPEGFYLELYNNCLVDDSFIPTDVIIWDIKD